MENLISTNGLASSVYYTGATIVAIFLFGFYVRQKLTSLAAANMVELEARVRKLEVEALRISEYEKDMKTLTNTMQDLRQDVRNGITNLTDRLDTFILSLTSHTRE